MFSLTLSSNFWLLGFLFYTYIYVARVVYKTWQHSTKNVIEKQAKSKKKRNIKKNEKYLYYAWN